MRRWSEEDAKWEMSEESLEEPARPVTLQVPRAQQISFPQHLHLMIANFCVWSFAPREYVGRGMRRTKKAETLVLISRT